MSISYLHSRGTKNEKISTINDSVKPILVACFSGVEGQYGMMGDQGMMGGYGVMGGYGPGYYSTNATVPQKDYGSGYGMMMVTEWAE